MNGIIIKILNNASLIEEFLIREYLENTMKVKSYNQLLLRREKKN